MKRRLPRLVAAALVAVCAPLAAVSLASASNVQPTPKEVVTFDPAKGQLPAGLAFDASGAMYVSFLGSGDVMRIAVDGTQVTIPIIPAGAGHLTGLAVDAKGNLFVAAVGGATTAFVRPSAVYEVANGEVTQIMTLPVGSQPTALAFLGGRLFVSDANGMIWLYTPTQSGDNARLWVGSDLLAPLVQTSNVPTGLGATGIAWFEGSLYVAVSDTGRIVRIPLSTDGRPGQPKVFIESTKLVGAYGIAFDQRGGLYVSKTPTDRVLRIANGHIVRLAGPLQDVTSPMAIAFGRVPGERQHLFIANAALRFGMPCVMMLDVGVRGLPLP